MIHFLSTQTILDILAGQERTKQWLASIALNSVEISAVSIGQVSYKIRQLENAGQRRAFERALPGFVSAMHIHQGIVPFDENAAEIWPTLMEMDLRYQTPGGSESSVSATTRMTLASVLSRNASYVDDPQPFHTAIPGFQVVHCG